ncbi:MAG: hypothetical protein J2P17_23195 [Mycobacterium sp.]|nr:hypothetical protein [Mycobacterium sp.]
MSRLLMNKRWNWLVCVRTVALVAAVLPVTPVRAARSHTAAVAEGGWKPASKRNWWDRLWRLHKSNKAPTHRDLTVQGVPRRQAAPVGRKLAPPKRVGKLASRRTANARFFKLSDGRVQAEVSALPVNYRAHDGSWQPIDTHGHRVVSPSLIIHLERSRDGRLSSRRHAFYQRKLMHQFSGGNQGMADLGRRVGTSPDRSMNRSQTDCEQVKVDALSCQV